jgi:hypothetical protein
VNYIRIPDKIISSIDGAILTIIPQINNNVNTKTREKEKNISVAKEDI